MAGAGRFGQCTVLSGQYVQGDVYTLKVRLYQGANKVPCGATQAVSVSVPLLAVAHKSTMIFWQKNAVQTSWCNVQTLH